MSTFSAPRTHPAKRRWSWNIAKARSHERYRKSQGSNRLAQIRSALASKVYAATPLLPSEERFGLNQQLRRAAISIASNIAEGSARGSRAEFIQFLHVARGSLSEIETQVMIAVDQGFIKESESPLGEIAEVGRLLNGLIRSLAAASRTAHARACAPEPRSTQPD